ncbi:TIM barrel protein [Paenibacillus sp. F411]|uniref:sugar phosphate isomerase/epimerase family protein n=1 Tax=Paenibacillus sp. F411 TaxID=2820239 RepID=UPI001AAE807A|nr:TIM barrel protein [Paenibacillus sp. F411]MBO2942409.1 TIM barrel protein [Paenibacillus sp. F411]
MTGPKLYAMDTFFYTSIGTYRFEARCEMIKELGFDAMYLTYWGKQSWEEALNLRSVHEKYGLGVAGMNAVVEIEEEVNDQSNAQILSLLRELEGCPAVELSLKASAHPVCSDESRDHYALQWLEAALQIAEERGIRLLLYPHCGHWLERTEDAVRLCRQLPHPLLGMTFSGYHWYVADGEGLRNKLKLAMPYLGLVNKCGSRKIPGIQAGLPATIETLDAGELDNFVLLSWLQKLGYQGPIGFQGYAAGGDVYSKLRRNLEAYYDMSARLQAHPSWSDLEAKLPWL